MWEAAHKLVPTPVPAPPPSDQKLSAEEAEKAMSIVKAREDASSCSVSSLAHLRTHATMDHFIHQIVNIDSEEKLAKQKLIWTRMTKAHAQLAAGLSQGSVELVKHVENLIKRQGLDEDEVALWIDWQSIYQDDKAEKLKGVASLIKVCPVPRTQ